MHSLALLVAAAGLAAGEEPAVLREGIAVEPHAVHLLEGWVRASSGEARLEAEVAGAGGAIDSTAAPPVPAGAGWTYTSTVTRPVQGGTPASARVLLSGG